jgi:hypothetical protein
MVLLHDDDNVIDFVDVAFCAGCRDRQPSAAIATSKLAATIFL